MVPHPGVNPNSPMFTFSQKLPQDTPSDKTISRWAGMWTFGKILKPQLEFE